MLVACLPIDLWHNVIYPAFFYPFFRIPKYGIISFRPTGLRTFCIGGIVLPYSHRTDPKSDGIIDAFYLLMHPTNQIIHIVPTRIGSSAVSILSFWNRIVRWIKIIIKMNCINIIIFHYFCHSINNILLDFFFRRIIVHRIVIRQNPIRMLSCHIVCRKCCQICPGGCNPVWIHPCMEFHPAFMRFFNHKRHWVITRILPLCSC